jgi:cell division FtsZ-interacting protein ZapD
MAPVAAHDLITFEQPLTERMRTFLRIEFLHEQMLFHIDEPTDFGARAAVASLLEVLTILGRGDGFRRFRRGMLRLGLPRLQDAWLDRWRHGQ